ncbi:MAG: lipoyl domain-containing protein [Pirellulaceae bacterium]
MQDLTCPILLPDLGLPEISIRTSLWLVSLGAEVRKGDRLLEVLAGEVTFDIASPADGILSEQWVDENQPIEFGDAVGLIRQAEVLRDAA